MPRGQKGRTHGLPATYTSGCRCDPCTWAWASYQRGERPPEPEPVWLDEWLSTGAAL